MGQTGALIALIAVASASVVSGARPLLLQRALLDIDVTKFSTEGVGQHFERIDGVGCNGPTVRTKTVSSREECEVLCFENGECNAYSWNTNDNKCFVKADACVDRDDNPKNLSGVRLSSAPPSPGVRFDRMDGVGCNGLTVRTKAVPSRFECEKLCADSDEFLAYSWNVNDNKCFLKAQPCTDREENASNLSGIKLKLDVEFDRVDGVGCNGPTVSTMRTESRNICEALCASNPECDAYSWNKVDNKCFMKADPCLDMDENENNLSGIKLHGESAPKPTLGPSEDFDQLDDLVCLGPDLAVIPDITDRYACEEACAGLAECLSYSYLVPEMVCFLKDQPCRETVDDPNFQTGIKLPY